METVLAMAPAIRPWKVPPVNVTVPEPAFRALALARPTEELSARNWLPLPVAVLVDNVVAVKTRDWPVAPILPAVKLSALAVMTGLAD
jgi:hypothetical protein